MHEVEAREEGEEEVEDLVVEGGEVEGIGGWGAGGV